MHPSLVAPRIEIAPVVVMPQPQPTERQRFLTGLAKLTSGQHGNAHYSAGELSKLLASIFAGAPGPLDVIDLTADLALRWEHEKAPRWFANLSEVQAFIRGEIQNESAAADVVIVLPRAGHEERLAGALLEEQS